ncbi:hypothetical protein CWI40_091010 [Ordospora colligata]|nr:hypothetical protein CWI40_091010 [Ordospora colligata]
MGENNETRKKRVSFATEAHVTYIYPEAEAKCSSGIDSGLASEDEVSVEMTVDCIKNRQEYIESEGTGMSIKEQGCINDDPRNRIHSIAYTKDTCGTPNNDADDKGFLNTDIGVLAGWENLVDTPKDHEFLKNACLNNNTANFSNGYALSVHERMDQHLNENEANNIQIEMHGKDGNAGMNNMVHDAEKEYDELDNTLLSNATLNVEEIINTQDLRKIIPQARRDVVNVSELLISKGIRFLDNLVVSSTRRDTISKSKNEVRVEQVRIYEKFVEPRTQFLMGFSEILEDKMKRQEAVNEKLEIEFEMKGSVFEEEDVCRQLKSLKSECRMKAKIEWYELRKEKELEFNEMVVGNKNEITDEYNRLAERVSSIEEEIEKRKAANLRMEKQIQRIRSRIDEGGDARYMKIDELKAQMSEQDMVFEGINKEMHDLEDLNMKKEIERKVLNETIAKINEDIKELEKGLDVKNVNELQLNEIRQEFKALCAIFGVEFVNVDLNEMRLRVMGYEIDITMQEGFVMRTVEVKCVNLDGQDRCLGALHEYLEKHIGRIGKRCGGTSKLFFDGMKDIVKAVLIGAGLIKELKTLKFKHDVECILRDESVLIVIGMLDAYECSKREILVSISNGFECMIEKNGEKTTYDLAEHVGILLKAVDQTS